MKKEHEMWAKSNGLEIVGVSAKTGNNVEGFFNNMTRKLMEVNPESKGNVMRLELEEMPIMVVKKKCDC